MNTYLLPNDGAFVPRYSVIAGWREFAEVVKDVSNLALLACLDSILEDEHLLAEAASRSHRHQLGFCKYVLMTDAVGNCLRLHLWDRNASSEEDIHSHCADFYSRVIAGQMTENSFELVPGVSHARFRYRFDDVAGHSVAIADGITGVSIRSSRVLRASEQYRKRAMGLHNVGDVEPGTMTISVWEARHSEALVLKPFGAGPEDCTVQVGIPKSEFRAALLSIKKRIIAG